MSTKKHVVILNTLYPPFIVGGAERSVLSLAQGLKCNGWKVSVITSGISKSYENIDGVEVYRYRNRNVFFRGKMTGKESPYLRILYRIIDELSFLKSWRIFIDIERMKPDVVFTNNMVEIPYHILWFLGRSSYNHVHTLRDYSLMCLYSSTTKKGAVCEKQCWSCRIGCTLRKISTRDVMKVVGVSSYTLNKHLSNGFFANSNVHRTIPNIYEDDLKVIESQESKVLRLGFIGSISDYKGVHILFRALSNISVAYGLKVAGRESRKGYLKELSKKYSSVTYEYLGWVNPHDFYNQVDVVIMPAIWPEPYPRTLIESRVYGLPVIVSDSGGTNEGVVDGVDGFIFKNGDDMDLGRYIETLARDKRLLNSMAMYSGARSKEYSKVSITAKYEDLFESHS